jgi:hypothetical protein
VAAGGDAALVAPDRLRVPVQDGTLLDAEPVQRALGHATRPIDDVALHARFSDCGARPAAWAAVMQSSDSDRIGAGVVA